MELPPEFKEWKEVDRPVQLVPLQPNKSWPAIKNIRSSPELALHNYETHHNLMMKFLTPYMRLYATYFSSEDLIQIGRMVLWGTALCFDTTRACTFATYAYSVIPSQLNREINKLIKRDPADHALQYESNYDQQEVTDPSMFCKDPPIDEMLATKEVIRKAFALLNQREQVLVVQRYYYDQDNSAIGRSLGISRERVRQIFVMIDEKFKELRDALG